jgi:hypothetical protein
MIKFSQTHPIRPIFTGKTKIKASYNQRYLDHNETNALEQINEIKDFVDIEDLKIKNFVKDNDIRIDYGTLTLRQNGSSSSFFCPDGISRMNKHNTIGLCLREGSEDKTLFDKYFKNDDGDIRITYLDESGVYVDGDYTQTNDLIERLIYTDTTLEECFGEKTDIFDQKHYFISQGKEYYKWINGINFTDDTERINFFENLLDLYRVIYKETSNDVNSFKGANILGEECNGDGIVTNLIIDGLQTKHKFLHQQRLELDAIVKKYVAYGCSPLRIHKEPKKRNLLNWVGHSILSHETTGRGTTKHVEGGNLHYMAKDIVNELSSVVENNKNNISKIKPNLKVKLKNNRYFTDFKSIHRYRTDSYLKNISDIWTPIILKYERELGRDITKEEKLVLLFVDQCNSVISDDELWKPFSSFRGDILSDIDSNSNMKNLLYKHLIEPKSIDFMNKLCRALCFNKVNKKNHNTFTLYSQIDRLLGHLSMKGNYKSWITVQSQFKNTDELIKQMEHFLPREGSDSDMRFISIVFTKHRDLLV